MFGVGCSRCSGVVGFCASMENADTRGTYSSSPMTAMNCLSCEGIRSGLGCRMWWRSVLVALALYAEGGAAIFKAATRPF